MVVSAHITFLESLACLLALATFRPRQTHVLVLCDASAAVALINNLSSRSERLAMLVPWLLAVVQGLDIRLSAAHIPGVLNARADALSRAPLSFHEWRVDPEAFLLVAPRLARHLPPRLRDLSTWVDCFASAAAHLLPRFHAWRAVPPVAGCEAVDTLATKWANSQVRLLVPPLPLRFAALQHHRQCPGWSILCLPRWHGETAFEAARAMAVNATDLPTSPHSAILPAPGFQSPLPAGTSCVVWFVLHNNGRAGRMA